MDTPLKLLLVDDDEVDRRAVRRALEGAGLSFELAELTEPTAARGAITSQRFDCILLDYRLPQRDGLDVLREVRQIGFDAPVIMLTGQGDEQLAVELMKAGAADYLVKSALDPKQLARSITSAVELYRARELARDAELRNAALNRIGAAIAASLDLDEIVQKVTEEATALCRAAFGAFFYNVVDPDQNRYMLYTIAGVPRSHFEQFPMPRVTEIFGPTFRGEGTIRSGDITRDPRYGKSAPYHGMPAGHLPVRSYLAVSVVSRSGEVIGGLFFGHADREVFSERDARMLEGVAGQAALAIDNAHLYQASQRARAEAERERDRYREAMLATKEAERALELLANAGKAVIGTDDLGTMLDAITRIFIPDLGDWCSIVLRDENDKLKLAACSATDPAIESAIRSFVARYPLRSNATTGSPRAVRAGMTQLMSDVSEEQLRGMARDEEALAELRALGLRSALVVPLKAQDRVLGSLSVCSRAPERRYTAADVPVFEEVGRRTAAAIEASRLYALAQQERRRAEEANRAKDEFLAVVSHEIRNPLNAIMGWANVLLTGSLNPEQAHRAVSTIERNAKAQAQLIEDLLDVSRIVTGKMRIEVAPVDIGRVIENALDVVRHAADAKGVRLQPILDRSAGPLMGDADRLQQVVWNLLSNAVKFTTKGGRVVIRLQRIDSSIVITVEDTGLGIDPMFLPHVFDRFRQADMATTRVKQGLGLGLAIVRHIAELHGGSIDAFSEGLEKGSTFTLRLPVSPLRSTGIHGAGTPLVMSRTSSAPEPFTCPPELDGLRILVVDDEPDARELLVSMLTHCKAEVQAAGSAEEALDVLRARRPDLLVSDIGMPETDGYALIQRIRALPDNMALIPAIALTAYARAEDRTKALLAGFNMHVSKPIEPAELLAAIAGVSGRRRATKT
jgi:signal transduction histidine kinase/DNA-binding response OmpR family regulator